MTKIEALRQLRTLGTAQIRKVYARHGVKGEQCGVSFANLGKLKKAIKTDHDLAEQLWPTGNHDARILACMVAEPARVSARQLETRVKNLGNYVVAAAKRIRKVAVDHGQNRFMTPDAIYYMKRAKEYRQKRRRSGC